MHPLNILISLLHDRVINLWFNSFSCIFIRKREINLVSKSASPLILQQPSAPIHVGKLNWHASLSAATNTNR